MRHAEMPSERSLSLVAWPIAGLLALMACSSPDPVAGGLLLTFAFLVLAAQTYRNRRLNGALREKAETLRRDADLLERSEGLGGYGRWCVEMEPRRHMWSEEMCNLAGLPAGTAPREDILKRVMPEGLRQIEIVLQAHAQDTEPFSIEFEIFGRRGEGRILHADARNIFSPDGEREQVFMVVRDVSEAYALRRDRDEAVARLAQAEVAANTDALTGLANRRFVMAELDRAVIRAMNRGELLSIVVFDIDHFKQVNDRFGHPVGDKVIATVAAIAAKHVREIDLVGRVGGEEFVWLMPDCDSNAAMRAAERLCWAVEAGTHSAPIPSVTISAGHAEMDGADSAIRLFARADAALYEAKRGGRNRVAQAA